MQPFQRCKLELLSRSSRLPIHGGRPYRKRARRPGLRRLQALQKNSDATWKQHLGRDRLAT
jgi:hypothetical protein